MKKFLLPFLLLIALSGGAYWWAILEVQRGTAAVQVDDARLRVWFNLVAPSYADTTAANLNLGLDYIGAIIHTKTPAGVYFRDTTTAGHKWTLIGTGGGGGLDTIFVTQIGVGSPQIPLLYAVDGNLRTARLVPGIFTTPFMNIDSAVGINLDTTGVGGAAYKAWIIAQYGPPMGGSGTNIYNTNGTLTDDRYLSGPLVSAVPTKTLFFDSLFNFYINASGLGNGINVFGLANSSNFQVNVNNISGDVFNPAFTGATIDRNTGDSLWMQAYTFAAAPAGDTVSFSLTATTARLKGLPQANDTTAYKPLAVGTDGILKRMDGWAGSGGGGGGQMTLFHPVASANYTVSATTGRNLIVLPDLTGQANHNIVLQATPTDGTTYDVKNNNTNASTFNWTFTNATVKDNANTTITTLSNLAYYELVYDATANLYYIR